MTQDFLPVSFPTSAGTQQSHVPLSQLAEMPGELIEQVGQSLGQSGWMRLSSTSQAMRATVTSTPSESLAEPSRRERTLGARIERQNQARANMAKGLYEHHSRQLAVPLPSTEEARQLLTWGQDGSIPRSIVTHRAGADVLTAPEVRSSDGLGVPEPHRFFNSVPLIQTTADMLWW